MFRSCFLLREGVGVSGGPDVLKYNSVLIAIDPVVCLISSSGNRSKSRDGTSRVYVMCGVCDLEY